MKGKNQSHRHIRRALPKNKYEVKEGAWKLAYADFVTSMMCFFMLMWLLNATPSEKLKSMAMYFKPTIGFFSKTGANDKDNDSNDDSNQDSQTINENTQAELLENMESKIITDLSSDSITKDLVDSISTEINGEGLQISIFDNNKNPMFQRGSTQLTDDAKKVLAKIAKSIIYLPSRIVIGGHTEKMTSVSVEGYTGWDISAGRAVNAMKVMQIHGLPEERIAKLVAYGDNNPIDKSDPNAPRNRRITVTILSKWSTVDYKAPISKSALSLDD